MGGVRWEATDGYGEQFTAESAAVDKEELLRDIRSMIVEIFREHDRVTFSVDAARHEIAAPDQDYTTHVMRVPLIGTLEHRGVNDRDIEQAIQDLIKEGLALEGRVANTHGPWRL